MGPLRPTLVRTHTSAYSTQGESLVSLAAQFSYKLATKTESKGQDLGSRMQGPNHFAPKPGQEALVWLTIAPVGRLAAGQ